jgi:co-chaperonin GroES (HSP10)
MIKPVNKNVLLKRKNNESSIIIMPKEHNDFYMCISQGDEVSLNLVNKCVFVKEGLIKVEYDGKEYYLCDEKNILAVVEE